LLFSKFFDTDVMAQRSTRSASVEPQTVPAEGVRRARDFVYAGEQFTQDGSIVDTKIVTPRDQFDITYTLVPGGDNWHAVAITVEDVNLIAAWQSARSCPGSNNDR
jgi:hypothetical protein